MVTTNRIRAACVDDVRSKLRQRSDGYQAIVVVSGVANALTGEAGRRDHAELVRATAENLGVGPESVLAACTGVIGPRLPLSRVTAALPRVVQDLGEGWVALHQAASAILTTDTTVKMAGRSFRLTDGRRASVVGIAKGSGMIAPVLSPPQATTLAFLLTDAPLTGPGAQEILRAGTDQTFNMVCVDGDTSTNDMVLLLANGAAGGPPADSDPCVARAVEATLEDLAQQVAADGEGATKLLTVEVHGAADPGQARQAARAVTRSPLVKTALFGADPNVGRIACALGYSGAEFDPSRLSIALVDGARRFPLLQEGRIAEELPHGGGSRLRLRLRQMDHVRLRIDLGAGTGEATAWGCDLSHGYVHINSAYRT
jgi:glutamate N-acetyltransferase/amino-acid N-acetyltransferase